jgi:hypothetical protein
VHSFSFLPLKVWAPGLRRILIHTSGGEVDGVSRNISTQLLCRLEKWLKQARSNRVNEPIDGDDWAALEPHSFCGTGYAIVTTYENLRRNADIYAGHDFSYVLLDEAQKIKNPDAVCHFSSVVDCWHSDFIFHLSLNFASIGLSFRTSRRCANECVLRIDWPLVELPFRTTCENYGHL